MNRIKELRNQKNLSQEDLGQALGLQKAAISKYETGSVTPPSEILLKLSELFEVSIDYILGLKPSPAINSNFIKKTGMVKVPVLGMVHAGSPMLAVEQASEFIELSNDSVRGGMYFYMEVEGDCMTGAGIIEGSLVLVRSQPSVENGQIAVVRIGDEVVLRKVKWIGKELMLIPANPKYEPMIVTGEDAQIVGRVIEVRIRNL